MFDAVTDFDHDNPFGGGDVYWVYPEAKCISYANQINLPSGEQGLPATGEEAAIIEAGWQAAWDLHVIEKSEAQMDVLRQEHEVNRLAEAVFDAAAKKFGFDPTAMQEGG